MTGRAATFFAGISVTLFAIGAAALGLLRKRSW